jgi:uncharacterized protein (TIGR02246 family)
MGDDERAIRELLDTWHRATAAGDTGIVLDLMADDALFLVAGRDPFGKDQFAKAAAGQSQMKIESSSEIEELEVAGPWAWIRKRLTVTMTPAGGEPKRRTGSTLTILRKQPDGRWVLARDANLLPPA